MQQTSPHHLYSSRSNPNQTKPFPQHLTHRIAPTCTPSPLHCSQSCPTSPPTLYRFGIFELDTGKAELRRRGLRVKLHAQPFQILTLLLERPTEILTREDIARVLWPDGTFVDFDHGVNSAINRLREALGDKAANPRFIETQARRGYRWLVPVERIGPTETNPTITTFLASPDDLPRTSHTLVQTLFLALQLMYLGFYIGALANLAEINDLLSPLPHPSYAFVLLIATAALLLPVRTFLCFAVLFRAPALQSQFRKLWLFLLPLDLLWSLAPFLLLHHINAGVALACTTFLVYSPFAQRALILMGAGTPRT